MTGERLLPNLGLTNRWTTGSDAWGVGMDADLAMLDALLFLAVKSATQAAPPASPAEGDRYIVAAPATGAWAGKETNLAVRVDGAWTFYVPRAGWKADVLDVPGVQRFDGTAWAAVAATSGGTAGSVPAGHRYWRVYIKTNGYLNSYASLAEVAFAAAAGGSAVRGGTPLASMSVADYADADPSRACDGNTGTFWGAKGGLPAWWGYDFGAGNALAVAETRITSRPEGGDATNQAPATWDLQWSDDGASWTTQQSYASAAWAAGGTQAFAVAAATGAGDSTTSVAKHRYWQILITSGRNDYTLYQMAEVQFRKAVGQPLAFSGGVASASNELAENGNTFSASLATDGDSQTIWSSANKNPPNYWRYVYPAGGEIAVKEVMIQPRGDSGPDGAPWTFDLQWSDDGAIWTTLQSFSPAPWTAITGVGQPQNFAVTAS